VTIAAAMHPRLQGILITGTGMAMFVAAMSLIPRIKVGHSRPAGPQLAIA